LDDTIEVMISFLRFQLKVECYYDTLVGLGPTSLKGLVQQATGLDPRAMRFYFMQCPMNADDRTVSSYGVGNDAIVALRMAYVSEPNLRPSVRTNWYTSLESRRNDRPEKWLERKACTLKDPKDAILSDGVTLVQKWTSIPANQHSSPLERASDLRQASDLIYMKDFSRGSYEENAGGGARPWDGLSAVRCLLLKSSFHFVGRALPFQPENGTKIRI
jgi:hypothetical protein